MLTTVIHSIRRRIHPAHSVKISAARKIELLLENKKDLRTFIETGTEFGGTIQGIRHAFDQIHSVELDAEKYANAVQKFADDKRITLYHGDSAKMLPEILKKIDEPCLIWLDAHGPGTITMHNSPMQGELEAIFSHPHHHTILIDDARHFSFLSIRKIQNLARKHGYHYALLEGLFRLT